MKILHISNYMYPHIGGIEQVARDCMNALNEQYEQKLICFNHEKGTKVDFVDGIEVTRVGCQAKVASQSLAVTYGKHLSKLFKSFNPDVVLFHYPNPFVAHFLLKHLKHKKFKFILYWHLDITKQKLLGKLFINQNKKLLKYADKIVATSPNYIEGSPWLLPNKEKCVVIPNCVNDERVSYNESHILKAQEIKEKYSGKTICFAFGRHVPYKGLTYLIKASKCLDDSFVILIGGKGPLTDELKLEAKDDKKVEFLGRISDDELKSYLLACDIFCFPSITKNEAFGIGLAEAMYFKKPTVTFTIPGSGVNYVSRNGIEGIEVDNGDYKKYAEALILLSKDEELRNKYGNNGYIRSSTEFTNKVFNDKIIELLK